MSKFGFLVIGQPLQMKATDVQALVKDLMVNTLLKTITGLPSPCLRFALGPTSVFDELSNRPF